MERTRTRAVWFAGALLAGAAALTPLPILAPPAAAQPNLQPYQPAGWSLPLVPRGAADAAWNSVPWPPTLPGDALSTYWNESCWNAGTTSTGVTFVNHLRIDGVAVATYTWPVLPAASYSTHTNGGPLTVRGGRHTFELRVDSGGAVAESNEADNATARQWIWTPLTIAAGTELLREAPPARTGGWESIPAGQDRFDNCDGLRFTNGSGFHVVFVNGQTATADCDVYLHNPSPGALQGFAAPLAASERGAGGLDGVIVNGHVMGTQTYDVGIVNYASAGPYVVRHLAGSPVTHNGDVTINGTLAANEMLKIWDVYVGPSYVGGLTVQLQMEEGGPSLMLQMYSPTFGAGSLSAPSISAVTDEHGFAFMDFGLGSEGYFALVLMRDIVWGAGPRTFSLRIRAGMANTVPWTPEWYHAPIVPRPVSGPTSDLPDTLLGDELVPRTYFNVAATNIGSGICATWFDGSVLVDGIAWGGYFQLGPLYPDQGVTAYAGIAALVEGGRHTVTLETNRNRRIGESNYYDNFYAEQYCWSPTVLAYGVPRDHGAPPDPTAGQAHLGSGETFYPNCVGYRLLELPAENHGLWRAAAVMPKGTSDVDIDLHLPLVGVKDGFRTPAATSDWGPMHSDWVLWNPVYTTGDRYDVGVRRVSGTDGYVIEAVDSPILCGVTRPVNVMGSMGSGEILDLYCILTDPWFDPPAFRLDNLSGDVDWGLAFYDYLTGTLLAKSDGVIANAHGPGQGETLATEGYMWPGQAYCLAVYKTGTTDLYKTGAYNLRMAPGVTGLPDSPPAPARTVLLGASPNPFNPRTAIRYELAHETKVRLAIHDAAGRRVRVLDEGTQPAGRHAASWDGRSDAGAEVPSGVYFCRLEAGEYRQTVKLTLLK